jgi:hypothetical protein
MGELFFWMKWATFPWIYNPNCCGLCRRRRLGGTRTIPIDVRLVAATNRNLARMMGDKLFRSDLYTG